MMMMMKPSAREETVHLQRNMDKEFSTKTVTSVQLKEACSLLIQQYPMQNSDIVTAAICDADSVCICTTYQNVKLIRIWSKVEKQLGLVLHTTSYRMYLFPSAQILYRYTMRYLSTTCFGLSAIITTGSTVHLLHKSMFTVGIFCVVHHVSQAILQYQNVT
jgi:hypothetical protein